MWLCTNRGFYSVVKIDPRYGEQGDNTKDEIYAVRARSEKHLHCFNKKVFVYPYSDYEFRVYLTESELQSWVLKEVNRIDYTNFKNSVKDDRLHDFFVGIWHLGVKYLSR